MHPEVIAPCALVVREQLARLTAWLAPREVQLDFRLLQSHSVDNGVVVEGHHQPLRAHRPQLDKLRVYRAALHDSASGHPRGVGHATATSCSLELDDGDRLVHRVAVGGVLPAQHALAGLVTVFTDGHAHQTPWVWRVAERNPRRTRGPLGSGEITVVFSLRLRVCDCSRPSQKARRHRLGSVVQTRLAQAVSQNMSPHAIIVRFSMHLSA
eukprot:4344916-Prymnesium_polylepis.3